MTWFHRVHSKISKLVRTEASPAAAMTELVAWCASTRRHAGWSRFQRLGIAAEMPRLERWLQNVLRKEPPAKNITAFWFGLFATSDRDDTVRPELYVAGSPLFTGSNDEDWNTSLKYWPKARYAGSQVLAKIYARAYRGPNALANDAEYPLTLGYAAFSVAHLCRTLRPALLLSGARQRAAVVGFDEGDMLTIGVVRAQGFEPSRD